MSFLHEMMRYQLLLSNTNNLRTVVCFQVFLSSSNYYVVYSNYFYLIIVIHMLIIIWLVMVYGISTLIGYLISNSVYIYIYIYDL